VNAWMANTHNVNRSAARDSCIAWLGNHGVIL
jgi:hypothetical protein